MKKYIIAIALLTGMMAGACNLRSNENYVLNPDGGGKISLKTTFLYVKIRSGETLDDAAKRVVKSILTSSTGVDTWKNVKYSTGKDNSVNFEGTAYFTDFNTVVINNITLYFKFKREETKNGYRLVFRTEEKKSTEGDPEKVDEVVNKKLTDWGKQKGMFQKPIEISRIERTYNIKAKSVKVSNMKLSGKKGKYSVNIVFDGPKIFEAMDISSSNESAVRKNYLDGTNKYTNEVFMETLFGNTKPVTADVSGAEIAFNYAKEVAAAKKAYPAMYAKLNLEPATEGETDTKEDEGDDDADDDKVDTDTKKKKGDKKGDKKSDKKKDKKKKDKKKESSIDRIKKNFQ
ncbi:MAG: hypothetical protein ABUK01_10770 [Leptospirales bacterium]